MNRLVENAVTVGLAIVTLAMLAVLVSSRAQTANVVGAVGSAFTESLATAEAPVTGSFGAEAPGYNAYF
jgi:hypothetical protein